MRKSRLLALWSPKQEESCRTMSLWRESFCRGDFLYQYRLRKALGRPLSKTSLWMEMGRPTIGRSSWSRRVLCNPSNLQVVVSLSMIKYWQIVSKSANSNRSIYKKPSCSQFWFSPKDWAVSLRPHSLLRSQAHLVRSYLILVKATIYK